MGKKSISEKHPIVAKKINESLDLSVREGSVASVSTGFGLSYFSPFALAMNATASQVGILYAIINLLPSIVQMWSAELVEKFSRKRIVLTGVFVKVLLWIPIILTGVLYYLGVPYVVWIFIVFVALFYAVGGVNQIAWFSWMGSLVPEGGRGTYFSRRNRWIGFFSIVTMILGAIILDWAKGVGGVREDVLGFTLLGFGFLFFISAVTRAWTLFMLNRQYEPRLHVRKKDYFSLWDFLKKGSSSAFGRFVYYRGALSFVVAIAGPFWAVYMLRDLGLSYVWYMAITVATFGFRMLFLPLLGKVSDKFGNIKLMTICSWAVIGAPLAWLAAPFLGSGLLLKIYLLIVPQMFAGFGWGGYDLAVNNYVYDAVKAPKRGFGLSYMNLFVGLGMFFGAALGTLIVWIGVPFMNTILFVFGISSIGRILVVIFGTSFLREVRHVKEFSPNYLVREFHPVEGAVREIHDFEHLVEKVEHYV